jgi:hypothetical protein
MSKPIKRHLKVGGAPEDDEGTLIIRMHPDDLPKGIKWNRYIYLTVKDSKIACRVRNNELAEVPHPRVHQININKNLRNALKIKLGTVYDFYVSKASFWKAPSYIMRYHPDRTARRNTLLLILGAVAAVLIIIGGVLYYFLG